eukprot:849077-Pleurochrysis_carterae.AAC.1
MRPGRGVGQVEKGCGGGEVRVDCCESRSQHHGSKPSVGEEGDSRAQRSVQGCGERCARAEGIMAPFRLRSARRSSLMRRDERTNEGEYNGVDQPKCSSHHKARGKFSRDA